MWTLMSLKTNSIIYVIQAAGVQWHSRHQLTEMSFSNLQESIYEYQLNLELFLYHILYLQ